MKKPALLFSGMFFAGAVAGVIGFLLLATKERKKQVKK
jgi:hypothetical protein